MTTPLPCWRCCSPEEGRSWMLRGVKGLGFRGVGFRGFGFRHSGFPGVHIRPRVCSFLL